jgi:acyl carrier protein
MEREAILSEVKRVFVDHLSIPDVSESTHLFQDLKLDSIQQLTLVVELENRFRLRFEESDEKDIATVRDVVDVLSRRLAER